MTTLVQAPRSMSPISLRKVVSYLVLTVGAVIILIPFIWMVSTSLKPPTELFIYPPRLFPSVIRWQNYIEAPNASFIPLGQAVWNSLLFALPVAFFDVITSAVVAFGFARLRFRGSNVLFFIVLSTMMLPPQVTMIPLFILFARLGWVNTYLPLVVQALFGLTLPGVQTRLDCEDALTPAFFAQVVTQETQRALAAVDDPARIVPWVDAGRAPHDGDPMSAGHLRQLLGAAQGAGLQRFLYHHQGNLTPGEWAVMSALCGEPWQPLTSDYQPPDEFIL